MTFLSTHLRNLKSIFSPTSSMNCFCIATRKRNDKYTIKNKDCGNKIPILSKIRRRKNKQCDTRTNLHSSEPFIECKKKDVNQLPIIDCTTPSPSSSTAGSTSNKEQEKNATQKNIFLSFALKRYLQPYKTCYELEWNIPSTKVWLQLDKQTSRGIERVRRLGFTDLDVRLDDKLTKYMNDTQHEEKAAKSILMEILFCSGDNKQCHDNRKDSVLSNNVQLLRLRRVHWWTKDYNLARLYFA